MSNNLEKKNLERKKSRKNKISNTMLRLLPYKRLIEKRLYYEQNI